MTPTFDLDIDPGPAETSYSPSTQMIAAISQVAAIDDLDFRFWCAKTLAVNMSTVIPLADAEDVVVDVVSEALNGGEATDQAHQIQLDAEGALVAVGDDGDFFDPEDFDLMIFQAIVLPSARARQVALLELAKTTALGNDVEVLALALRLLGALLVAYETSASMAH